MRSVGALWEQFRFVLAVFSDVPKGNPSFSGMFGTESAVWDQRVGSSNLSTPTTDKTLKYKRYFRFCLPAQIHVCGSTVGATSSVGAYQPKYKWRRTKLDENDEPRDTDWSGYDGEIGIGRIQLQPHGPMKDQWLWSGHGPAVRQRLTPHQGYEAEGREAMRMVEDYYDRLMAHNGMRGNRQK